MAYQGRRTSACRDERQPPHANGNASKFLSEKGHDVTWWATTFVHYDKDYLCKEYREIQVNPNEKLILLHTPKAYKKNVSFTRLKYLRDIAGEFIKHTEGKEVPDLIFCAWPTMEFAAAAVKYGREHNVPVIADIRDCWPDIYYLGFPKILRPFAKAAIEILKIGARKTLRHVAGITGITPGMVEWGCKYAGRPVGKNDRTLFMANTIPAMPPAELEADLQWWAERGITRDTWNLCFFGSQSIQIDLATAVKAARLVIAEHEDVRFIIGGEGDNKQYFMSLAEGCSNILFTGQLNQRQMNSLMTISKCGVYSLRNIRELDHAFGNKIIQYLSFGLPVLNSLQGYPKDVIDTEHCGLTYREGDPDDCAQKILQLYNDEPERQIMAENAHALFIRQFEDSKVNQQFEDYFYEILSNFHSRNS